MQNSDHITDPMPCVNGYRLRMPTVGTLHSIDGQLHRVLATLDDHILLVSVADHRIYLEQDASGSIGLPRWTRIAELMAAGRISEIQRPSSSGLGRVRLVAEIEMLDAASVRNGTKAISIFLYRNWTADLRERFGEHDDPAMLKRWRTAARRAGRPS